MAAATRANAQADTSWRAGSSAPISLLVRSDDGGMSHSVNLALERLMSSGLPLSVSVMFPTPWYQETVELLKRHPDVAVGVHLTLNSEWKGLRWGPVAGASAVPTLVDANGLFFPTSEALHQNHPDGGEVERELREVAERLAREYGLGMAEYFGERRANPQYDAPPPSKGDSLVALVRRLTPGVTLLVTHVGLDDAELGALVDMNTDGGLAEMSGNRQGELDALMSARFRDAVRARGARLVTYRQLIEMQGLKAMQRPGMETATHE